MRPFPTQRLPLASLLPLGTPGDLVPANSSSPETGRASALPRTSRFRRFPLTALLVLLTACLGVSALSAQQIEPNVPLSQRSTINLAAGMPGYIGNAAAGSNATQSQWWYENSNNLTSYSTLNFTESTDASGNWKQVGLPYDPNITRTFINQTSGGGAGSLTGTNNWYRLHFKVDKKYATQKFMLDVEGAHTGVQIFVNGTLLPGISQVKADAQATHVIGFVPVVVDLTPYLFMDGTRDNVIAIDVSRNSPWFESPAFSGAFRFGQAMSGLFRNVKLVVTNPVHIPLNVYSNQATWGTYVGTKSIVASPDPSTTATATSAVVEVQTNVVNNSNVAQQVTLTTQIVDATGKVVVTADPITQTIAPTTPSNLPTTATPVFDQTITVPNPTLWYPNASTFGKPYMYRVYHIVSVNGAVVDSTQSPLGIRLLTWDHNFPYFNGHQTYLWGASGRYDYPALGSSVPDEPVWRDLAQFAAGGGNVWRPGHSSSSEEFVEAADAYGIMIDQPSGDGENGWTNPSADDTQLKLEVHRDMIIRDRSHPSILDWELDNGGNNISLSTSLNDINNTWDNINPRVQASRAYNPAFAFLDECDGAGCEVANKHSYPDNPAFGAEYWNNIGTGRGLAWDNELAFAAPYLNDWRNGRVANTFGMAQWYFAETPGEVSLWSEYQGIVDNRIDPANGKKVDRSNFVRALGYSMVDQNRFPKLLYYIYAANWTPYSVKPVVALAHHWNRAYEYTQGTPIQENAFSNCPAVRLLINGQPRDPVTGAILADQTPNPWNVQTSSDMTQNSTVMPGQVHWMVNYAPGTVTAACLDPNGNIVPTATDTRTTAGAEYKIVLTAVPELVKPDGSSFQWTSNGSDAAFVVAQVVDQQGNIVPTAADNVTFSVSGPAQYMGGTQQIVADPLFENYYEDAFSKQHSKDIGGLPYAFFHAPGDPELNFEGGLTKIALRSTITPGTVTVTATAPGLVSGSVQLTSVEPPAPVQTQAPVIIVPPSNTAVTAGYSATFTVAASGSGALSYQWSVNGSAVAGATSSTYTTPATTLAQDGESVSVTVSSTGGFAPVTSNPVTLSVSAPANVAITTQPQSQSVVVGQSTTLTVAATGSPQINYQWFQDNVQVASGPQNSFTTPLFTAPGTHTYTVTVSNHLNSIPSANAVVTVNAATPVSFTQAPASAIVATNQPVKFSATVAGSAPFTYSWNYTPKGGATTILLSGRQSSNVITYNIVAMSAADVGTYTVTVNNAANAPATSAGAMLTLAPPGVNLALNRPAVASSSQNACQDGTTAPPYSGLNCLGAENAVDGNLNTRWASQSAGKPPTTPVTGVDPSWLQVDLGSVQAFNTVILNWEAASAAEYQIQYTNQDPTTNPQWSIATSKTGGAGGVETITFPTVQARYVRLYATLRNGNYGYSVFEFQVYNVPACGGPGERYTINTSNPALVLDNLLGLTWTRTVQTDNTPGAQFTGDSANAYCASIKMRVPTAAEAQSIAGPNNASCAISGAWNTWTSTVDPNNASESVIVGFDGSSGFYVTNNFPGETLCTSGNLQSQAAAIQTQPTPQTVTVGQQATFSVVATGKPAPTYQWLENGNAITGATAASYVTPVTVAADNGSTFSVVVNNGVAQPVGSTSVSLTVNAAPVTPPGNPPGNPPGAGNGNTNNTDTAIPGFGNGPIPIGPNLAHGIKPVSNGDENSTVYPPSGATDGDLTTRWGSAFVDAATLTLDLGTVQNIGQVVLRWERAYGVKYIIQVSTDGQIWTDAFTQNAGQGGSENLVFPAVSGRYIRFKGVARSSAYGYSLWEFEVYGPVGPTIVTQPVSQTVTAGSQAQFTVVAGGNGPFTYQWSMNGTAITGATAATYTTPAQSSTNNGDSYVVAVTGSGITKASVPATVTITNPTPGIANLALNKYTTSSPVENPGLAAVYATDGNLTSRWASTPVDSSWIQVDLGTPTLINKVQLNWENAYGSSYILQVSDDGASWSPVYTQTAGKGGVESIPFNAVIKRFVRMQGVTRATPYGYSLFEFQIFGADVPSITTQPAGQTVQAGATATFSVTAGGSGPFTYQWLRNGATLPGATSSSYTTPVLYSADNGSSYTVNVSNKNGAATTAPATVKVTSAAPAGANFALNQKAVASSTQDPAGLNASFAVDGSTTTRWASAQAGASPLPPVTGVDPSSIYVDLVTPKMVSQVVLTWENASAKGYQIQVSNDAQTWQTVYTQTAGQGGTENITFPPVSARYVQMVGTLRNTNYGYSLFEFAVYGTTAGGTTPPTPPTATAPTISTQPSSQTVSAGSTATFSVTASGSGALTYQWMKNNTAIAGATGVSYTTPVLAASDSGEQFTVLVSNASGSGSVLSTPASLTIGTYTVYPGFLGVDLNNNTHGAWTNDQIYVTVIGFDPTTKAYAYLKADGTIVDFTSMDSSAPNHLTQGGHNYGSYSFTLAQSTLLKIPKFGSARAYVSLGAPLYVPVYADASGKITGYAGPNPQNGTDPNAGTHFDWYEFDYQGGIFINTTQVDEFGLPLMLDVWANGGKDHKQVGITETIAQLDSEFAAQVPAAFQPNPMSNLRIFSPAKLSLSASGANAHYFDNVLATAWSSYATTPITITVGARRFTGKSTGNTLNFTEVNPSANFAGETFAVQLPSTQDILGCAGKMASGVAGTTVAQKDENMVQLQLENQICSATNRGVLLNQANWTNVASYYQSAPANFYSQFWHNHSVGGLAYGFSYDDNNNQSTTIQSNTPEHMAFGIGW